MKFDSNSKSIIPENNIPSGWATGRIEDLIGEFGLFCDGDWVESKDQNPRGNIRLIQLADIGDGYYRNKSSRFLTKEKAEELKGTFLKPDDLLIARLGEPLGKSCTFPGDEKLSITAVDVCIVRTGESDIPHKWLMHSINSTIFRKAIRSLQSGTTRKRISRKNLAKITFPIPPLQEQHRIVAKIEELFTKLDAGVESLKQAKAQLKRYRQSILKAVVEGRLTAEWREQHKNELEPADKLLERILEERRKKWESEQLASFEAQGKTPPKNWQDEYIEPEMPDSSNLPELPKGWIWVSLETISDSLGGFAFKSKDYAYNGYQIIKIGNVKMNSINLEKSPSYIKNPTREIVAKYLLIKNDVLITLTGTRRKRDYGFVAIVKNEKNLLLNQRVARLRFSSTVNPEYYAIALQSEEFRDRLFANETGNVGQGNIGMGAITEEAIPLPSLYEQSEIIGVYNRLTSVIDSLEIEIKSELKRAQSLRKSILKHAFEGKLVPQDPNDEPASVLLERIKTEKVKPKKSKQLEMF